MKSKRNRLRLTFSLRGLLIILTVFSVFIGYRTQRYHEWQRLNHKLMGLGAHVVVHYPKPFLDDESEISLLIANWLSTPTVEEVTFHGDWSPPPPPRLAIWSYWHWSCQNADDGKLKTLVESLTCLEQCPKISLIGTEVSDNGLLELQRLRSLEELDLTGAKISSVGVKHLGRLKLRSLDVSYTGLSDSDISVLATFLDLRVLDVSMSNVTEDGANRLRSWLPDCTVLRHED